MVLQATSIDQSGAFNTTNTMSAGGKDRLGQRPLTDTLSPGTLTGLDYVELPRLNKVSHRKQPLFFI